MSINSNEIVIIELQEERAMVEGKLNNLNIFLNSEDFNLISPRQQELLKHQDQLMRAYNTVLMDRITDLQQTEEAQTTVSNIMGDVI